jgi:hypothetical protein
MPSAGGDRAGQAAAARKVSDGNQLEMVSSQPLFAVAQPGVMSEINGRGGMAVGYHHNDVRFQPSLVTIVTNRTAAAPAGLVGGDWLW